MYYLVKVQTVCVWMEKLTLALSDKHKPSPSPNPFNILFVDKFEIITSTYAKLFISPEGLKSHAPTYIHTHTQTHILSWRCVSINLTQLLISSTIQADKREGVWGRGGGSCGTTWDSAPPQLWHRHLVVVTSPSRCFTGNTQKTFSKSKNQHEWVTQLWRKQ